MTTAFLPLPAAFADFLPAGEALLAFASDAVAVARCLTTGAAAAGFPGDLRLLPVDAALSRAALGAEASLSTKCLLRFTGSTLSSCVRSSTS